MQFGKLYYSQKGRETPKGDNLCELRLASLDAAAMILMSTRGHCGAAVSFWRKYKLKA